MNAHLFIIHFPISLVAVAAVLDLIGVGLGDQVLRDWSWRFLMVGATFAFLAFATGEGAKLAALGTGGIDGYNLEMHQQWGSAGIWGLIGAALLRTLWRGKSTGAKGWLNLALVLAATGLVTAITITGTLVRHAG